MDEMLDDIFMKEEPRETLKEVGKYKVIIADDDLEVHTVTKMILRNFKFEGKGLLFIDAYSGIEAIEKVREHHDAAIILLDVVMEENNSGLIAVQEIRKNLGNSDIRIILRTGQPGDAPEERIIVEYDINDYKLKTELTSQKMFTTMYSSLRSFRDIRIIEKHKKGLEKIIKASAKLFSQTSLTDFLSSMLYELSNFYKEDSDSMFIRGKEETPNGFVCVKNTSSINIIAATGHFEKYIGDNPFNLNEFPSFKEVYELKTIDGTVLKCIKNGFIIYHITRNGYKNYICIEGEEEQYDFNLIKLFLDNYSSALDVYQDMHI